MHANVLGGIQDKVKLRASSNDIFLQLEKTYIIFNGFFFQVSLFSNIKSPSDWEN